MSKSTFYIAHPVSGDPVGNAQNVIAWTKWFVENDSSRIYVAPWVGEVLAYGNDHVIKPGDPFYERILKDDEVVARKLGNVALVGGSITPGMFREMKAVFDISGHVLNLWKYRSPADLPAGFDVHDLEDLMVFSSMKVLESVLETQREAERATKKAWRDHTPEGVNGHT